MTTSGATLQDTNISKWLVSATVMTGAFMAVMDITVVNLAMPHMMGTFGESLSAITWVATSYSIASIVVATMAGWLTTLMGRKKLYFLSFLIFTIGSILCGMTRSFYIMLIFRVVQGIGGGALIPISQAVMRESFPEDQQSMAMAIFSMGVVIAPGAGAILGGFLTQFYGWPWVFYINVPFGIAGMFMIMAFVHDPEYLIRGVKKIDFMGIALLLTTMTVAQVVLERGQQYDWLASKWIRLGILVTVFCGIALVIWEIYWAEHPVINFRLLKNIPLSLGATIGVLYGLTLFGVSFIVPQFTQTLMGYSAFASGEVLMPRALTLFLFMPIVGWLYKYIDSRILIFIGTIILWFSLRQLGSLSLGAGFWTIIPIMLLLGCGMPFMFVTMSTVALSTVPKANMTEATSIYTLSRRIGGNIGYAVIATIVARRSQFHHSRLGTFISAYDPTYSQFYNETSAKLIHHGMSPTSVTPTIHAIAGQMLTRQSMMMAYNDVAYLMGIGFLATIPFVLMLPSKRKQNEQLQAKLAEG